MEFDKEIKAKNLLDEYVICHFGNGREAPFYAKSNFTFTTNFEGPIMRFGNELDAQTGCAGVNEYLAEIGHELAGKVRVCRLALQVMPVRDVAGDGEESAHFTPRKKPSKICPAQFDQVSPEDLVDDFPAPLSDDPDVEFGCGEE